LTSPGAGGYPRAIVARAYVTLMQKFNGVIVAQAPAC
jgi:hypothetical protein